jgi:GTP-binding protein EngB required for normal cell division
MSEQRIIVQADDGVPRAPSKEAPVQRSGREQALGEYRRRKLVLAELVQELMALAHERHDEQRERSGQQLLARLAEDSFRLAVVGQFNRGKSTLMNAILGAPYLPTGALPMTAVLTTVSYGSEPRASVRRAGSPYPIDVPFDRLARFVTQQSGEREELQIVAADVQVPAEILRLGFCFVDTPGIGSAIATNTATTEHFLPDADAVIFVTSCDAPLSEAELEFLAKARRHAGKLFLVLNKADLVSGGQACVVDHLREQLGADLGDERPRVFATSARDALTARIVGDREGLRSSGLVALEEPLVAFLSEQKSRVFLQQTCARVQRLLAQQRSDLDLAHVVQVRGRAAHEGATKRFEQDVAELLADTHAQAEQLLAQFKVLLTSSLLERSRAWPAELTDALDPLVALTRGHTTHDQLEPAWSAIEKSAQPLLDDWLKARLAELHTLLFQIGGDRIEALLSARHRVEAAAPQRLGLAAELGLATQSWSPADLPALQAPALGFHASVRLPRWFAAIRLERNGSRRLREALKRAVNAYCEQACEALIACACQWAELLDLRVAGDVQRTARRVRGRLETPYTDEHDALLRELNARLCAFGDKLVEGGSATALGERIPAHDAQFSARTPTQLDAPCTICEQVSAAPLDYLAHAQYELATRKESRTEHAKRGGFCKLHTWLYAQTADPIGISLSYAELTQSLASELRDALSSPTGERELLQVIRWFLPEADRCPVCDAVSTAERDAIAQLTDRLVLAAGERPPPALCLVHLLAVLEAGPGAEHAQRLVRALAETVERSAEDMRSFALKRQSLRRGLLSERESVAYLQAIGRVASSRALARPWRTEDDDRLS